MLMKIHCPGCRAQLRVPETSSGKAARCPACKKVFRVPAPSDMFEETISTWIESDVDEEQEKRVESLDPSKTAVGVSAPTAKASAAAATASPGDSTLAMDALDPRQASTAGAPAMSGAGASAPARGPAVESPAFPDDLFIRKPIPHLVVRECNLNGVTVAFDSSWLEHDGFRASMPVKGVISLNTKTDELLARPLAFVDRSSAAIRSAQDLEARFEQRLLPGWTARHLLSVMGTIEQLPRPFNMPMPYYIHVSQSGISLKCTTKRRVDGGYTCEVVLPSGQYALEWLLRVNGVCGPEYDLLERELDLIKADSWSTLPEQCRDRIVVWCRFLPRERFIHYIADADFGVREAGLAGLVITDRRLVFHKYHHSGEHDLTEEALLTARVEDDFAHLTIQNRDGRNRVIKLHVRELTALEEIFKGMPNIKFSIG